MKLEVKCKCGQVLSPGVSKCPNCQKELEVEIKQLNQTEDGIVIHIILFLGLILACIFSIGWKPVFAPYLFFGCIATIVHGFIKYPESRAIKVLFWLCILAIVGYMIFLMVIIATCNTTCKGFY